MRYIPNTPDDRKKLLDAVGAPSVDALFESIPEKLRLKGALDVPDALPENAMREEMARLAAKNRTASDYVSFLGAGAYHHYIPAVVNHMLLRSEFFTSYTPYQPEISQGTLQAIFEYQTMMSMLMGTDVSNASLYDGSSAFAEAVLMALRVKAGRKRILVAESVHGEYRETARTYVHNIGVALDEIPADGASGLCLAAAVEKKLGDDVAAVAVQSPNFFGGIEDVKALAEAAHKHGALLIVCVPEPLSFALLKPPGELGADIVVGEGQAFGAGLNFGGPWLGFMGTRSEFIRQMPGRLVGETVDKEGKRGFVLTLSTREQHIRREKATSNICTNQSLIALAASIYLALMGRKGIRRMAEHNAKKAHRFAVLLQEKAGLKPLHGAPFFNEFTVRLPRPAEDVLKKLRERGILGGHPVSRGYAGRENDLVVCVTEMVKGRDLERAAEAFKEAVK